jgi:hypothetical protein
MITNAYNTYPYSRSDQSSSKLAPRTLADLGAKAGLDASTISRLENGSSTLHACAEALRQAGIEFRRGGVVLRGR